jgi:hypothetical protein
VTVVASGLVQRTRADRRVITRGYSRNRQDYDARRRAAEKTRMDKAFWAIVKRDPCAYCGAPAELTATGVNDVDHIENLDSGGQDGWENYTGACPPCNRGVKKDRDVLTTLLALTEDR